MYCSVSQGLAHVGQKQGVQRRSALGQARPLNHCLRPLKWGPPDRGAEEEGGGCPLRATSGLERRQSGNVRGSKGRCRGQAGLRERGRTVCGGSRGTDAVPTGQPPLGPSQRMTSDLIQRGHMDLPSYPQPPYQRSGCPTEGNYNPPRGGLNSQIEGRAGNIRDATHGKHVGSGA
ncbi:hypothetical protein GWK47_028855 [Chionoecetes opilio]|uniref:Uncharacterized protein n=1 Tax=Chionoecetes opilio TaxID=41210 RepID=A0A8J4YL18_CHIOP|nr:hypothetical protein GWK47_028855 [Chionoecetes opilio]